MQSNFFKGLVLLIATVGADAAEPIKPKADNRPNIVIILTDDMGFSDPGCFGGEIQTPNIDALAAHGLRFSQFYNCSRCCQTRASLLTGAYAQRVGLAEFGATMDVDVPTLAERLKTGGYQTAIMGKWHLSELPASPTGQDRVKWLDHQVELPTPLAEPASLPTHRGFERFYGIVWGVVDHFDPFSLTENETAVRSVPKDFYLTDAIAAHSASYINVAAAEHRPFFLYVAFEAPHWPIQARAEDIAKYKSRYDEGWDEMRRQRFRRQLDLGLFDAKAPLGEVITQGPAWQNIPADKRSYLASKMEVHAAMVDRVDQGIGRIVDSLRATKQLDNTIIFVLSDNGASPEIPGEPGYDRNGGTRDGRHALRDAQLQLAENRQKLGSEESYTGIGPGWASASNTPLRFWKMESYDGGCRTPLVVHWPAGLKRPSGSVSRDIGHVIDIAPTCLDLAHVDSVGEFKMDGVSLVSVLDDKPFADDRTLYFAHRQGRGVRQGQWKASKLDGHGWELFNADADPGETHDISGKRPEVLNALVRELADWRRQIGQDRQARDASKATTKQPTSAPVGAE
jgi:arylsulfatase